MDVIEKLLHVKASVEPCNCESLPFQLKQSYAFNLLIVSQQTCLLARPLVSINLVQLRKQRLFLMEKSGLACVFLFQQISAYVKRKFIEEGIPFIVEGSDVYLPFLGIALQKETARELPAITRISRATQVLLISGFYENLNNLNVTDMAKKKGVAKMTVTRSFDQIQALGLPFIRSGKKRRHFAWTGTSSEYWRLMAPHLRSPVWQEIRLEDEWRQKPRLLGGMSALAEYGMLADNTYETLALTKEQAKRLPLSVLSRVPSDQEPGTLIHVLQYVIPFRNGKAIDPISAWLCLTEIEKAEPRVEIAFEKTREKCAYDSRH